jgi:hypothetical protein
MTEQAIGKTAKFSCKTAKFLLLVIYRNITLLTIYTKNYIYSIGGPEGPLPFAGPAL